MKVTIEVSPEEVKELFNADKLLEIQKSVITEMITQSLKTFNPMDNPFFTTYGTKGTKRE